MGERCPENCRVDRLRNYGSPAFLPFGNFRACRSYVELSKGSALEAAQLRQIRARFGVPFGPAVSGERALSTDSV